MARSRTSRPMAQSGVLQASRIQLIRGLVRTMTKPTSPPGLISLPQVSSAVGRLFRWETDTGTVKGVVVGVADDGAGVQALVVEIGGTTRRPDGSTYHVTWSLGPGRRAVESNDVIRACGWTAAAE